MSSAEADIATVSDRSARASVPQATRLLAAIVDSSDDAIISKKLDGTITSWNKSAERIFGYTQAEAVGQPITLIIPRARWDEEKEIIRRLKRGERIDHFETVRAHKDGSLLDVSARMRVGQAQHGASPPTQSCTARSSAQMPAPLDLSAHQMCSVRDRGASP